MAGGSGGWWDGERLAPPASGTVAGAPDFAIGRRRMVRQILACACTAAGLATGPALGLLAVPAAAQRMRRAANLPPAVDLSADAVVAQRQRVPLLLFFDRDDCPYCERALREYLLPMTADPAWRDRALFRQIEIDRALPLVGFDRAPTTHRDFAARRGVYLTPTVAVVDGTGRDLTDPIVGLTTLDFYGAYLENAITSGSGRI
jgi:hypothetical protein